MALLPETSRQPTHELSTRRAGDRDEVCFEADDPRNPRAWPASVKWTQVVVITLLDLTVSWGASGFSPAQTDFQRDLGVSAEVGELGLSLYVLGLALGPMTCVAPASRQSVLMSAV